MCWSTSSPATRSRPLIGTARFLDPHRIEVTSGEGDIRVFQAERFLIAVGTRPHRPDGVPFNGTRVFDSDEIVEIPRLPRSLTVIGAGVIGVEYATIFSALDVAVALVEARPTMLDFIDHELIEDFTHQLARPRRDAALRRQGRAHRSRERLAGHHPGRRPARALRDGAVHRRPRRRDRCAEPAKPAAWTPTTAAA